MKGSVLLLFVFAVTMRAETGYAAWLRYAPVQDANVRLMYQRLPAVAVALDSSAVEESAQKELIRGVQSMLGRTLRMDARLPDEDCILLGTLAAVKQAAPSMLLPQQLPDDAYLLETTAAHGHKILLITATNDR